MPAILSSGYSERNLFNKSCYVFKMTIFKCIQIDNFEKKHNYYEPRTDIFLFIIERFWGLYSCSLCTLQIWLPQSWSWGCSGHSGWLSLEGDKDEKRRERSLYRVCFYDLKLYMTNINAINWLYEIVDLDSWSEQIGTRVRNYSRSRRFIIKPALSLAFDELWRYQHRTSRFN